ncbi:MAG: tyrosine-type recombinase/integrase [Roseburia sp.]
MTVEEELAVRDAAGKRSTRDRAIIDVLLSTGMRVSEIQRINRTDVDLDDSSITFWEPRTGDTGQYILTRGRGSTCLSI